jgi:hypothetical protein
MEAERPGFVPAFAMEALVAKMVERSVGYPRPCGVFQILGGMGMCRKDGFHGYNRRK